MLDDHEKLDYIDTKIQYIIHNDKGYLEFKNPYIYGIIKYDPKTDTFIIQGQSPLNQKIKYWAANPIWSNYSYSGSGLPFPNHEIAYQNTINQGQVLLNKGQFTIKLLHPSEYYVDQGKKLLKPHVHLQLVNQNKIITLVMADYLPYRSLTSLPNRPNRTIGR